MHQYPISYDEPLFRPPSEGRSLIIQVTYGCSWNACSFCEMYTSKQFKARPKTEVFKDIEAFLPYKDSIRRVFLADGDPLVLSTQRLLEIIEKLKNTFPRLTRISTYASPNNLGRKSISELKELKAAGLDLIYVGIESGDDDVLKAINKGETFKSTVDGLLKANASGLSSSVMIINGLGGQVLSKQHAQNSAKLLNEIQPKYASTLVLNTYKGLDYFKERYNGEFILQDPIELLAEMRLFMNTLELNETIFRSDHASNYLALKGVLGRDKAKFINQIDDILDTNDRSKLKAENLRGF